MTGVARLATELRVLADRFRSSAEETRSTFVDDTRSGFDLHIVTGLVDDVRALSARSLELDTHLERALRLLD